MAGDRRGGSVWRNPAVVAALGAAIIAGTFGLASSLLTNGDGSTSDVSTSGGSTTSSKAAVVTIGVPAAGAAVGQRIRAQGTASLPSMQQLWLVVEPKPLGRFYPQDGPIHVDNGTWSWPVGFGDDNAGPGDYVLYAVVADGAASQTLKYYSTTDFSGLRQLPSGAVSVASVSVQRR